MKGWIAALLVVAVAIVVGIGTWLGSRGDERDGVGTPLPGQLASPPKAAAPLPPAPVAAPPQPPPPSSPSAPKPPGGTAAPPVVVAPPGAAAFKPDLDLAAKARDEIDNVGLMFRDFRTLMGENPVGSNAEIMKAVTGGNPRQARLGPPTGQQLNDQGELVDAWGTPYFFHQMSATHMDIRSAGPDKKLNTADDIVGR